MADEGGTPFTWTRSRPLRRGSAPDVRQVVDAAVEIAGSDGIEAVSMRRVAAALHSGTASLYRILEGREELLDRMIDAVLGEVALPPVTGEWRGDLADVARTRYVLLRRHHWLGPELAGRPSLGPNALDHHEHALAAAAGLTTDPTSAASAVETVLAYVLGAAARETAEAATRRRTGLDESRWRAVVAPYLRQALATGEYPHLDRAIHEAVDFDPAERFERGLACILDGLGLQTAEPISRPSGGRGGPRRRSGRAEGR